MAALKSALTPTPQRYHAVIILLHWLMATAIVIMLLSGATMALVTLEKAQAPIVLLADKQTTGGYPIIGCLSQLSITELVQSKDELTFKWTEPETAHSQWHAQLAHDKGRLETNN